MSRILFLQPGYAHYRDRLFAELSARHDVVFVYDSSSNVYPGKVEPKGIRYCFADKKWGPAWLGIIYWVLKERPEIVISSISTSYRTMIAFLYAALFRKKMILWILEWKKPQFQGDYIRHVFRCVKFLLGRKFIRSSDALIVGGTAAYNYARSLGKGEADIFVALQCANDISKGQVADRKKTKDECQFLYLSRIVDWKGLDILLKAFAQLEKERPGVSLVVGGDGPFKEHCVNLAHSLKLKHVDFVGSILPEHVCEVYRKADVYVLPSYWYKNLYEAWGLVINEAMSAGLPVIATTAVGASFDLVSDCKNGIVVQDGSVSDLYTGMREILDLDLQKMGQCSRTIYEEKNNFDKMADAFTHAISHVER